MMFNWIAMTICIGICSLSANRMDKDGFTWNNFSMFVVSLVFACAFISMSIVDYAKGG